MTALDNMIGQLRGLASADAEIAKRAAPRIEAIAKKTAAAGTTPDGKPWANRKADGARALVNAAARVRVEAKDNIVTIIVDGPEYWHQKAKPGASLPQRKVIPNVGDPIPVAIAAELAKVTNEVLSERTGTR